MAKIQVSTKINNENIDYLCEPHDTMLDVLRNQLNLTGSKKAVVQVIVVPAVLSLMVN